MTMFHLLSIHLSLFPNAGYDFLWTFLSCHSYLETNDWDFDEAIREAQQDAEWEQQEAERVQSWQTRQAQQAAKTDQLQKKVTIDDPYRTGPEPEDDPYDCLACFAFLLSLTRKRK